VVPGGNCNSIFVYPIFITGAGLNWETPNLVIMIPTLIVCIFVFGQLGQKQNEAPATLGGNLKSQDYPPYLSL